MKYESIKKMISFSMYFTPEQYESLQKSAFKANISISDYIKSRLKPVGKKNFIYRKAVEVYAEGIKRKTDKFIRSLGYRHEIIEPLLGRKKHGKS